MKMTSFAAAAVLTATLALSTPASALTLTFFVDVQSSTPGAPAVADFYETWTFTPTYTPGTSSSSYKGPISGLAATPQTADLLDFVGLTGGSPFGDAGATNNTRIGATSLAFRQGIDGGGGRQYRHELSLQSPKLGQIMASYDDAGLIDFITTYGGTYIDGVATGGGLTWLEGAMGGGAIERYDGKAYLSAIDGVSLGGNGGPGAVPEPTTWALMILGFGAAGAMLRRRPIPA